MPDPIVQLLSTLGTPAGIILVWWLLSRDVRAVKDLIDVRLTYIVEDLEGIKQIQREDHSRHLECQGKIHDRITTCAERHQVKAA